MRKFLRNIKIKLGLFLLTRYNAILPSELKWYLSSHRSERMPVDSNIYVKHRFYNTVLNDIMILLEMDCVIIGIKNSIDINNGDTITTISYIDKNLFANLVNWASNNLNKGVGVNISEYLNGNSDLLKEIKQ